MEFMRTDKAVGVYFLLALSFWNFPDAPRMLQGRELMCS